MEFFNCKDSCHYLLTCPKENEYRGDFKGISNIINNHIKLSVHIKKRNSTQNWKFRRLYTSYKESILIGCR